MQIAVKSLIQKLIIKNTAVMNVAVLQQIKKLWKSIMKKKLYGWGHLGSARSAILS
jgi:hypothetical protein